MNNTTQLTVGDKTTMGIFIGMDNNLAMFETKELNALDRSCVVRINPSRCEALHDNDWHDLVSKLSQRPTGWLSGALVLNGSEAIKAIKKLRAFAEEYHTGGLYQPTV